MTEETSSSNRSDRNYYVKLVDQIRNEEDVADFITLISTLEQNEMEFALPSLCLLPIMTEKSIKCVEKICSDVLLDCQSSRCSRKCVLAYLKNASNSSQWIDVYVLAEALEEPQFHIIRPILPRMSNLLKSVRDGRLEFIWVKVIISRAIFHSNGWIRVWAVQKAISIDPVILCQNYQFVAETILPNINNNDVFWRFLEKNDMDQFLEQFGTLIENIGINLNTIHQQQDFMRMLLLSVENLTCPTTIFFLSAILQKVKYNSVLNSVDLPLIRRVILRARYCPHKSMRIVTVRNFIRLFVRITNIDRCVLEEISHLISYFANESTSEMVEDCFQKIEETLRNTKYMTAEDYNEVSFLNSTDATNNLLELSRMFWISMVNQPDKKKLISSRLELMLSELLTECRSDVYSTINLLLYLCQSCPKDVTLNVLNMMPNQIGEYIIKRIISANGTTEDFYNMKNIYVPLFLKYCQYMHKGTPLLIMQILSDQKISCESHALLLSFFDLIIEKIGGELNSEVIKSFFDYYGASKIGMNRQKRSIDGLTVKEFNNIVSLLHSTRLKLYNRFVDESKINADEIIEECVEQLDVAASFNVKQEICNIIARFISKARNVELKYECVRACKNIINEEKKSLNSLPALNCFVRVAMHSLNCPEICQEIVGILEEQLTIAHQNTQVALAIIKGISEFRESLGTEWAEFLVKLALFGPVPKKEMKVLSFAYFSIFEEENKSGETARLEKDELERIDEVVQRARFRAIVLCVKLAESKQEWAIRFMEEIVKSMKLMDQSSSRSFGLSMAHRQKTRAVELLNMIIPYIENPEMIETIFDYCILCIIDPCQQFSIKLIVEWTVSQIAIKFTNVFERLISSEFVKSLANKRIGSVSSWINILMLMSRTNKKLVSECIEHVACWTSAQNFPVRCKAIAACRLMHNYLDKKSKEKYAIIKSIVEFSAEPSGNSKRVIENLCNDFFFSMLNPTKHFDMQTILIEIAMKTGMPNEETIPMRTIKELNTTKIRSENTDMEFLNAPSDVYSALMKNGSSAPSLEDGEEGDENCVDEISDNTDESAVISSFQRKIMKEDRDKKKSDASLILVASLVDKPTNLGGICRTCEIFGVDTLVISDLLLAEDSNFKALSMSSENWQNIEAVKPQDLLAYLEGLRAEGYKVIAAEQTTDSVMMHDFVFPTKAVVVMGDEKEGVPVNLLRAVDQTVEIKQVGHTRSLNVHVTAALFISKFAEQIMFSSSS